MDKYDKYLPQVAEPEKEEEDLPELQLDADAIKFAQLRIRTPTQSEEDVAEKLGIDIKRLRKWRRNPYFQAYMIKLKRKLVDEDVHETIKKQAMDLINKEYLELAKRHEDPFSPENQQILDSLDGAAQKEKFLDRFAYFTPYDKLARTRNETVKSLRMMLPENMETVTEVQIKHTLIKHRNQFEKNRQERIEREREMLKLGLNAASPFAFKPEKKKADGPELLEAEERQSAFEGETTIDEFTIKQTRRSRNDREEDEES